MTDKKYAHGSCQCKKVKFIVAMPASWGAYCHCTQCQKIHGSAFASWIGFLTNDYEIIDPEKYFKKYDSGTAYRGFCSHCGSSFFFQYHEKHKNKKQREYVGFARPNIETEIDFEATEHIYYESHASWLGEIETLPKRMK